MEDPLTSKSHLDFMSSFSIEFSCDLHFQAHCIDAMEELPGSQGTVYMERR